MDWLSNLVRRRNLPYEIYQRKGKERRVGSYDKDEIPPQNRSK